MSKQETTPLSADLHPDTFELVKDFSIVLSEKLLSNQKKYGYQNEWLYNDWEGECREHMMKHIKKGDPRDLAIYAAFMWKRGWSTAYQTPKEGTMADKGYPDMSVNEYNLRQSWDAACQERDDLKNQVKALEAIKKGLETSFQQCNEKWNFSQQWVYKLTDQNKHLKEGLKEITAMHGNEDTLRKVAAEYLEEYEEGTLIASTDLKKDMVTSDNNNSGDKSIEQEAEKLLLSMMKENSPKLLQFFLSCLAREMEKTNATDLELSCHLDVNKKRYKIVSRCELSMPNSDKNAQGSDTTDAE